MRRLPNALLLRHDAAVALACRAAGSIADVSAGSCLHAAAADGARSTSESAPITPTHACKRWHQPTAWLRHRSAAILPSSPQQLEATIQLQQRRSFLGSLGGTPPSKQHQERKLIG